jgi:predicted acetyltransferase
MEIRFTTEAEVDAVRHCIGLSFGYDPSDKDRDHFVKGLEQDRLLAAFDGSELVGTGGAYSFELTVPGGTVDCGGTTVITVISSHRRQGVLTGMMRFHLDDVVDHGESVAALWASEAAIYGRFGFGVAAHANETRMERARIGFMDEPTSGGRIRILGAGEAKKTVPAVYERLRPNRPGFLSRDEEMRWDNGHFHDPEHWRSGSSAKRWAVYHQEGEDRGYAVYRQQEKWEDGVPASELVVGEVMAETAEAERELWRFLVGIDLVGEIRASNTDPGSALPYLVTDRRRVRQRHSDGLWVRILDVPGALGSRLYPLAGSLTFEVADDFYGSAAGRFTLEGGPDGADCYRSDRKADIVLDVRSLSAVYLGGVSFSELARAGLVEASAGALQRADLMFSWTRPPWCPEVF